MSRDGCVTDPLSAVRQAWPSGPWGFATDSQQTDDQDCADRTDSHHVAPWQQLIELLAKDPLRTFAFVSRPGYRCSTASLDCSQSRPSRSEGPKHLRRDLTHRRRIVGAGGPPADHEDVLGA